MDFYLVIDNVRKGPFLISEMEQLIITSSTLVWTEGMGDWKEARHVSELLHLIDNSVPPPIPKGKEPISIETKIKEPIKVEAQLSKKKKGAHF